MPQGVLSQERSLKMLKQQGLISISLYPTHTNSQIGHFTWPPLLFTFQIALKNQTTTHFSPNEEKTFTDLEFALLGVT